MTNENKNNPQEEKEVVNAEIVEKTTAIVPVAPKGVSEEESKNLSTKAGTIVADLSKDIDNRDMIRQLQTLGSEAQQEATRNNELLKTRVGSLLNEVEGEGSQIPENLIELRNTLDKFEQDRGIGFYFEYISTGKGHGPFTELVDGSIKYDLICSMGINLLGHSHPLVIKSHLETATYDATISGNLLP